MGIEHERSHAIDPAVLTGFAATFIRRTDTYPLQLPTGSYARVDRPLTDNILAAHLKGYLTIGAYALSPTGWASWIALDADTDEQWVSLRNMALDLIKSNVKPYLEPSRRGGHLWLFTEEIPGFTTRRFARQLLAEHELLGIEVYPKQDKPYPKLGSLMRLALGVHRMTSKRYPFITPDGELLAPTIRHQAAMLADPQRVPMAFIDEILSRAPEHEPVSHTSTFEEQRRGITGADRLSERVKASIPVFDFVSQFIELDSRGTGHCPFHDDQKKVSQSAKQATTGIASQAVKAKPSLIFGCSGETSTARTHHSRPPSKTLLTSCSPTDVGDYPLTVGASRWEHQNSWNLVSNAYSGRLPVSVVKFLPLLSEVRPQCQCWYCPNNMCFKNS
jgi:hypothetical protein